MITFLRILATIVLLLVVAAATLKLIWNFDDAAPESATGRRDVALVRTQNAMVVAAHPDASAAGVEILKAGGSAIDAAVAIQAVLTLVEPQSSGIGGGAFILHFDAARARLQSYDGRETAPGQVRPDLFIGPEGKPYEFLEAIVGGRSVGVPGALRALEMAHRQHGKLPWNVLFAPAIRLCEAGFTITPRFQQLAHADPVLRSIPGARDYFYDARGRARQAGTVLRNPQLAKVLRQIADGGADVFYQGALASRIARAVQGAMQLSKLEAGVNFAMLKLGAPYALRFEADVWNPGFLSPEDLARYQAREREPVCLPYRRWRVCGFAPPSSGGIAVLQVLAMLERFELGENFAVNDPAALHLIAQAERLAFADRDRYVADPDFVAVPTHGLLDEAYLDARSALIDPARDMERARPGEPPAAPARAQADGVSPELPSTSHFSIVDAQRNVVSMTTSIEFAYGAHLMVDGFLLNNQLTDFSFSPGAPGKPVANAVAPNKRPRSSMAPMIVFDQATGRPVLTLGSPGGSRIIGYVVRAMLGVLEWQLDPQRAVSLPHVVNRNGKTELEDEGWSDSEWEALKGKLAALGHDTDVSEMNSGLHAISITDAGLSGGADPRREGVAAGW